MAEDARPIVAFDFDGTLTIKDSFTTFLAWRTGFLGYASALARLAPEAAAFLLHRDRGRIKAAAARIFLRGLPREKLIAEAEAFAAEIAPRFLRPDALACWEAWREKGARLVIVTASPTAVVAPFAKRLGADVLIGTELAFDPTDRVSGGFSTPNCRGPEKVERLTARFGRGLKLAAAYGDTSGDAEMLAIAEVAGYKAFKAKP